MKATRKRKLRGTIASVSVLALVLVACGEDEQPLDEETDDVEAEDPEDDAEEDDADEPDADAEEADADEADAPEDSPLAGEDITLTVGVSPGGGYDAYARLLAPHLEERFDANVVVNNEPGAGGLVALNNVLAAEPDGTQIMLINGPGVGGAALADAEGADFELDELTYVGRVSDAPRMVAAGNESGFESLEDLEEGEFTIGATGPGASTYVEPLVLFELMGWDYDLVTGYDGSTETIAGMIAGEVEGVMLDVDTVGPTVLEGDGNAIFIMAADERLDDFPDTPILAELDLDDDTRELADAAEALAFMGRTLVIHPETDPEMEAFIADSIEDILTSDEFNEEAEDQGRPIGFASQDEVNELVDTLQNAPQEFRDIVELGY